MSFLILNYRSHDESDDKNEECFKSMNSYLLTLSQSGPCDKGSFWTTLPCRLHTIHTFYTAATFAVKWDSQ